MREGYAQPWSSCSEGPMSTASLKMLRGISRLGAQIAVTGDYIQRSAIDPSGSTLT